MRELLTDNFRAFSARIGADPLLIQGPGGNTSIKEAEVMWIKASGKELADSVTSEIFVAVDRAAAVAEAKGAGDGTCKATVLDTDNPLWPSIETTFHAVLDWRVVAHTHSVAVISHVISPEGRKVAAEKLADLDPVFVPYIKPGRPLTQAILDRITPETRVILLENHGLIVCGATTAEAEGLMQRVERRLRLDPADVAPSAPDADPLPGFTWAGEENWLAQDETARARIAGGTYYPDHVVFLGPSLPTADNDNTPPAILVPGVGVQIRESATATQKAMLRCLSDVMRRVPDDWSLEPIGHDAEAALLNWDAEKYRQSLAKQG